MDMQNVTGSKAWEEMEGVAKAPHHRGTGHFLIGTPSHYIKREPEEGALERWEAQLQEFLTMLQAPHSGWGNHQVSPSPWEDAKAFLASFEQVASACRWPRDKWVTLLLPALSGEPEQAFSGLSAQDKGDYRKVPVPFAVMAADPSETGQLLPRDTWAGQVFREAADRPSEVTRLSSNEQVLENETNTLHQQGSVQGEANNACLGREEDFHDHQKRIMFENQPGLLNDEERSYESGLVEKSTFYAEVSREERESADSQIIECSEVQKASSDCRRDFERSSDLMVQQSIHIREKPYLSFYCGNSFIKTQGLLAHERTHTGLWNTYNYSNGGKNFSCSSGSMQHMRIHTGESLYTCSHCGKNFDNCSVFQEHVRLHTLETPYKCSDCGKSFDKKRYLNNHVRKHRGEKPYECLQCGKSFPIKSKLVKHEIIHMREKPYKCTLCGKTFVRKTDLCAHDKIHTVQ
ncbi:zinc finger and SCAN domain-containing protein 12-like isoform X1 [Podarcis lilfordi]|uniref:Zinc finger and SCAN domain-containing protein 12-like isoform X1 n=1 Tax=Podarcis lilfordi TaxID=74358 RepID=A0AA35K026_9SAUR|nr:zinc finger and SCAN domain-containing protein 12-like isoform X1 [Podarcis lilfordi]